LPLLVAVLVVAGQASGGPGELAELLLTPSSALTIAILVLALGAWRLIAMADAATSVDRGRAWYRGRVGVLFIVLSFFVVAAHAWAGWVAYAFYEAGSSIYVAATNPDQSWPPSLGPGATPDPTSDYVQAPFATPANERSRINVLLTGIDSAEERDHALTDTLIVASIDPVTGSAAVISVPRDISMFPLYNGGTFNGKINSLMTWARNHPADFPDGPLASVAKELGYLLGIPIHYYAAIDLRGFIDLIDSVGGVTVDNPKPINDPRYDWMDGQRGFALSAGKHTLDGRTALAYVRSRQGVGDNDFTRARRQQQVLLALRDKLTTPEMLLRAPDFIRKFGQTIRTNYPPDQTGDIIDLATGLDRSSVRQVVLGPTKYATHPPSTETGGVYSLRLKLDAVAKLSKEIFGAESAYASGGGPPSH
jgi:LCP family protein required for cell wall assembly